MQGRTKNVDICFLTAIDNIFFWEGGCRLGFVYTQFQDFFEIFQFLIILSLKLFRNSWDNPCIKLLLSDINLWQFRLELKGFKVTKYYKHDCKFHILQFCINPNFLRLANLEGNQRYLFWATFLFFQI